MLQMQFDFIQDINQDEVYTNDDWYTPAFYFRCGQKMHGWSI